jgi:hypothetical protein
LTNEKRTPLYLKDNNKVRNHFFPSQIYFDFLLEATKILGMKLVCLRITNRQTVKKFDGFKLEGVK